MYRKLLALLLLSTAAFAAECGISIWGPARFEAGIGINYLQASGCAYHFGNSQSGNVNTNLQANPCFSPGAQLHFGYYRKCFFAEFSYLGWGNSNYHSASRAEGATDPADFTLLGLPAVPNNPDPGWVSARARIRYILRYLDFRFGQYLHKSRECLFGAFINFRYLVRLEQKERLNAKARLLNVPEEADATFEQYSSYCGVGIGGGLMGEYQLCGNLHASGEFNAIIFPGTRRLAHHCATFGPGFTEEDTAVEFRDFNTMTPAFDLRAKLVYRCQFLCVRGAVEVGYLLSQYWKAIAFTKQVNTSRVCTDVALAGPYASVHIIF